MQAQLGVAQAQNKSQAEQLAASVAAATAKMGDLEAVLTHSKRLEVEHKSTITALEVRAQRSPVGRSRSTHLSRGRPSCGTAAPRCRRETRRWLPCSLNWLLPAARRLSGTAWWRRGRSWTASAGCKPTC